MASDDKKTPKEASNIFHNIMKASVTPKKADSHLDKFISAVKDKYGVNITLDNGIVYPKGTTADTVTEIQNFYKEWDV